MKTICCEKCGKELGFFDRKLSVNNDRLNIHHNNLCSKCAGVINGGLAVMDDMYNYMIEELRREYNISDMAATDLDLLVYLAAGAIYTYAPDFHSKDSVINTAFLSRDNDQIAVEDDLALLVDRLIEYGFAMNKKNAQIIDLVGYFKRNTLYVEQIGLNSKEDIPKTYYNMLITGRGIVASHMENQECLMMGLDNSERFAYSIINNRDIILENMHFPDIPEREPILFTLNEQQRQWITDTFGQINEVMRRQIENKRRNLITIVARGTMRDLKQIYPQGDFDQIPLECVLIFIVKNMMSDPEGKRAPLYTEDGPVMDILLENFYDNLTLFGRTERSDIAEYMLKNTLLSEGFYVQQENHREKGWAFFTTKGYIIGLLKSRKFVYIFENSFPNDIYYPCNECIYQGRRFLQIGGEESGIKGSNGNGLLFYSDDISLIGRMNRFFNLNNIFYVMDRYVEAEEKVYADRSSVLEIKRISDKLFGEFSFLPFCQYDEWAAIVEKVKEDDFLLSQLIDQKNGGKKRSPVTPTSYTVRIMKAFVKCAKELNSTLHIGDVSIAKAILWGYFNGSLIDVLSKEWIRITGDMVCDGDSLEDAFGKYFGMGGIESDKSYYMGLFIYYLMSKGILPEEDFLDNYERCIPLYRNYHKGIEEESISGEITTENETRETENKPEEEVISGEKKEEEIEFEDVPRGTLSDEGKIEDGSEDLSEAVVKDQVTEEISEKDEVTDVSIDDASTQKTETISDDESLQGEEEIAEINEESVPSAEESQEVVPEEKTESYQDPVDDSRATKEDEVSETETQISIMSMSETADNELKENELETGQGTAVSESEES